MSPQDTRSQIAAELAKGRDALAAGEALLGLELLDDAVVRFYYAALHHATAALLAEGVEASSHRGVQALFSQHLVRAGKLDVATARDLRRLAALRDAADYDRNFRFDRASAEAEAAVARALVARIGAWLAENGWLDATPG